LSFQTRKRRLRSLESTIDHRRRRTYLRSTQSGKGRSIHECQNEEESMPHENSA
jgi:hypothetical protein